jgi:hypothetical protein
MRNSHRILVRKSEVKKPLGDGRVDGRIVIKCILNKWDVNVSTAFITGSSGGFL